MVWMWPKGNEDQCDGHGSLTILDTAAEAAAVAAVVARSEQQQPLQQQKQKH